MGRSFVILSLRHYLSHLHVHVAVFVTLAIVIQMFH